MYDFTFRSHEIDSLAIKHLTKDGVNYARLYAHLCRVAHADLGSGIQTLLMNA